MTEFEKITTVLTRCQHIASNCIDCPYNEYFNISHDCEIKLHNDAHTMLTQMLEDMHKMNKAKDECIVCKYKALQKYEQCEEYDYDCRYCRAICICAGCENGRRFEWRGN